jgi:AraC-like DNA-binding protein
MALHREVLHRREGVELRWVTCRPPSPEAGEVEHAERPTLVLPAAGLFRLHLGGEETLLLDPTQALFLPAGVPHRYSHPAAGGDRCLAIELWPAHLAELLDALDPAAADRGALPYPAHRVALPAPALAERALLARRLRAGAVAGELEVDEALAGVVSAWVGGRRGQAATGSPSAIDRRHRERVEAVQLALAADPARSWRLDELAARVATAPCHLTTVFRRLTGAPIHRHLLRLRLARALEEVTGSQRELTAIGADLGFATPSHFAAAFRRAFGRSPSAVRRAAASTRGDASPRERT